jgi:hypothetical protein
MRAKEPEKELDMKLANLLAVVAILGLAGMAYAADEPSPSPSPKPKFDGIGGKIVKVDGAKITVKTRAHRGEDAKEVVVTTDDKTTVTLDDKDAKVADLKVDMFVRVSPAEGTATKIVASTKMPERHKPGTSN